VDRDGRAKAYDVEDFMNRVNTEQALTPEAE